MRSYAHVWREIEAWLARFKNVPISPLFFVKFSVFCRFVLSGWSISAPFCLRPIFLCRWFPRRTIARAATWTTSCMGGSTTRWSTTCGRLFPCFHTRRANPSSKPSAKSTECHMCRYGVRLNFFWRIRHRALRSHSHQVPSTGWFQATGTTLILTYTPFFGVWKLVYLLLFVCTGVGLGATQEDRGYYGWKNLNAQISALSSSFLNPRCIIH